MKELSVIVPALAPLGSVSGVLKALQAQTIRTEIEVIVLSRESQIWPGADRVVVVGDALLHEARALGVHCSSAAYVVLAEDHCFPEPDWAEALVLRLREGWDGVGPALRSGNPSSLWALAAFVLGYGEWIAPLSGTVLPGHNVALRRQLLVQQGESLKEKLLVGSLLLRDLRGQGARFCLEERARMAHWDCTRISWALITFLAVGSGFGAQRSLAWHPLLRATFALAAPVVAALHWRRAFRHVRRVGLPRACLIPALFLAAAWSLGECLGCALGTGMVARYVEWGEINRLAHAENVPS